MEKKIVTVVVKHNINFNPIGGATVHWSEHIEKPEHEKHLDPEYCKQKTSVTNQDGIAKLEINIGNYVKDSFNLKFKYLNLVWIRINKVECSGFKDSIVNKVFPPAGEKYNGVEGGNYHEYVVHLASE